jgi:acetone carboxylase gamma subunit
MNCKKEVSEDVKECECGSKFFAFGEKFHFGENGIVCDCGNDKFRGNMHMDYTHKAVNNYVCTQCGNPVGTESYRG